VNQARGQRTFVVPSLLKWHAAGVVGGGGGCNFKSLCQRRSLATDGELYGTAVPARGGFAG